MITGPRYQQRMPDHGCILTGSPTAQSNHHQPPPKSRRFAFQVDPNVVLSSRSAFSIASTSSVSPRVSSERRRLEKEDVTEGEGWWWGEVGEPPIPKRNQRQSGKIDPAPVLLGLLRRPGVEPFALIVWGNQGIGLETIRPIRAPAN